MKISDPLGKVYTHTMFNKKSKLSRGKKRSSNSSSGGVKAIGGGGRSSYSQSVMAEPERDTFHHRIHGNRDSDSQEEGDEEEEEEETITEEGSVSTKSSARARSHSRRRRQSLGDASKDLDRISYASSSHRHHSRRKSTVGLPYPPEGIGPPGTTYNLWTRDSFNHRRKFNRSLCGVLLGISILLVILGILGIIGIAVYLGVVQKSEPNGKDVLSIDGTLRVTSQDFSISLLNPETLEYRRMASAYSKRISKTFEKSSLGQAFLSASVAGFSSGSIRVFFTLRFDRRYIPSVYRENFLTALKRILSEEIASLQGGEFQGLEIDYSSIEFTKSARPGDEIQFFRPEPYLGSEPIILDEKEEDVSSEVRSQSSLWQNLGSLENQRMDQSPVSVIRSTEAPTTTASTNSPRREPSLSNLIQNRRKLILPPNRHPIELLTGANIIPTHGNGRPHPQRPLQTAKETVILNHPRRNDHTSHFRPNSIPINVRPSFFGSLNRRIDSGDVTRSNNTSFWDTLNRGGGASEQEKQFQMLLSKQQKQFGRPFVVSTSATPLQSTPKIKFEMGFTTPVASQMTMKPISIMNSGSSGLQVVDKSIPNRKNQDQISIGGSLVVSGLEEEMDEADMSNRRQMLLPTVHRAKPIMVTPHGQREKTTTPRTTTIPSYHTTPGPGNYRPPVDKTPHILSGIPGSGQQLIKHFLQTQRQKTELQRQRKLFLLKQQQESMLKNKQQEQVLQEKNSDVSTGGSHDYSLIDKPIFNPSPRPTNTLPPLVLKTSTIKTTRAKPPMRRIPSIRRQDLLSSIPAVGSLSAGLTPLGIFSNLLNVYATIDSKHDITGKILDSATAIFGRENPPDGVPPISTKTSTTTATTPTTADFFTPRSSSVSTSTTTKTTTPSIMMLNYVKSNISPHLPLRPKPPSEDLSSIPPRPYGSYSLHNSHQAQIYGMDNPLYFSSESTTAPPRYGPKDFIVETVTIDSAILKDFFTSKPTLLNSGDSQSIKNNVYLQRKKSSRTEQPDFGSSLLEKLKEMVDSQGRESSTHRPFSPGGRKIVTSKFKRHQLPPEIKITNDFSLSKFS